MAVVRTASDVELERLAPSVIANSHRPASMLRQLYYSILPYRSFFLPFLVVSVVAVPCWLGVRLVRHRQHRQPVSLLRELLLLTFVVYLSGVAAATLTPSHPSREVAESTPAIELRPDVASLTCSSATLPGGSRAHGFCVRNARGNVVLFLPLGILLPLVWRRLRLRRAMMIALTASVGIELLQLLSRAVGSFRTADVNDVILNVAGAGLGLALVWLLRLRPRWAIAGSRDRAHPEGPPAR